MSNVVEKPWEDIFYTDIKPTDKDNIHCACCIENDYSKYSGCPGNPSLGCGIYEDIVGTYRNTPENRAKREALEKAAKEKAEQERKAERQRRFDDAARAYNQNAGFISFGALGASFNYNGMSWSYDAVRDRAHELLFES